MLRRISIEKLTFMTWKVCDNTNCIILLMKIIQNRRSELLILEVILSTSPSMDIHASLPPGYRTASSRVHVINVTAVYPGN